LTLELKWPANVYNGSEEDVREAGPHYKNADELTPAEKSSGRNG